MLSRSKGVLFVTGDSVAIRRHRGDGLPCLGGSATTGVFPRMSRSVWSESNEDGVIRCTECGTDIEESCEHLLLAADVTFGTCEGGAAFAYWEGYCAQVQNVFAKCLQGSLSPQWKRWEVKHVWDAMHEDSIDEPEAPRLPGEAFISLMVEVLCWEGGTDCGEAEALSGGRCQSALRIMFASDPEETCKRAVNTLAEWLVPKKARGRKPRR